MALNMDKPDDPRSRSFPRSEIVPLHVQSVQQHYIYSLYYNINAEIG
jgi:hypothetical protein